MTSVRRDRTMLDWLLRRFGLPGSASESLVGDILEMHREGRSTWWLWAQVSSAISIGAWQEVRMHRLAALSGAATGFASLFGCAVLVTGLLTSVGWPHAADWEWRHRLGMLVAGVAYTILSGWIVARLHRTSRFAALFGFVTIVSIVPALELPLLYWFAPTIFFGTVVRVLPLMLAGVILAPMAILFGGLWDAPLRDYRHPAR